MPCPSLIPPSIFDLGVPHDNWIVALVILGGGLALAGIALVEYRVIKVLHSLPQSRKTHILLWVERIAQFLCLLVLALESFIFLWMNALQRWQEDTSLAVSANCTEKVASIYNQASMFALVLVGAGGLLILICANIVGYSWRRMERLVQTRETS